MTGPPSPSSAGRDAVVARARRALRRDKDRRRTPPFRSLHAREVKAIAHDASRRVAVPRHFVFARGSVAAEERRQVAAGDIEHVEPHLARLLHGEAQRRVAVAHEGGKLHAAPATRGARGGEWREWRQGW